MSRQVTAGELATPLMPYAEAVTLMRSQFGALPSTSVALERAAGLVLAEDVVASVDVPVFPNSSMDGYAVRSEDTADASPGRPVTLPAASAPKVMTGRPIPEGFDAVVPWERAEVSDGGITVSATVAPGTYVRPVAEDVTAGATVLHAGTTLRAPHIGLLAALGQATVAVTPRPRVAVLSTGDELVAPGEPASYGDVHDVNSVMLPALLAQAGADVVSVGRVGDDRDAIAAWLHGPAAQADLCVTSGGASVGEHDWLRDVLAEEGTLDLWRVAVRPGKPVAQGSMGGTPVFVLPGNPASVLACAHAFVIPVVRIMGGKQADARTVDAVLADAVTAGDGRTFLCPVRLDGSVAIPARPASSSVISNQLHADGFVVVPPEGLPAGHAVSVELMD